LGGVAPALFNRYSPFEMKSRLLMIVFAAALGTVALAFILFPLAEPRHQGKPISAWFEEELGRGQSKLWSVGINQISIGGVANRSTLQAFQAMGAKAVPYLVDLLQAKDSAVKTGYMKFSASLPKSVESKLPKLYPALDVRTTAAYILCALGPQARTATPALVQCLTSTNSDLRWKAVAGLAAVGPEASEAIPALILTLKDQQPEVRTFSVVALSRIDPESVSVKRALTNALNDTDWKVQKFAEEALRSNVGTSRVAPLHISSPALPD
jgi:hypothetical protein